MHKNARRRSFPCISKQLWSAFSYSNWRSFTKQKSVTKDTVNLQNGLSSTTLFSTADSSSPSTVPYSHAFPCKAVSLSFRTPLSFQAKAQKQEKMCSKAIRYFVRKDRSKQNKFHFHKKEGGRTIALKVCIFIFIILPPQ